TDTTVPFPVAESMPASQGPPLAPPPRSHGTEGRPGRGLRLRHGMVLAIEPMLIASGNDGYHEAPDGWTLKTNDRSRAAHAEHTVAITEAGPRILTER
ncbi:hypothetical protein ACWD25_61630, partial [Streptomyces sp. NPDC002920]